MFCGEPGPTGVHWAGSRARRQEAFPRLRIRSLTNPTAPGLLKPGAGDGEGLRLSG